MLEKQERPCGASNGPQRRKSYRKAGALTPGAQSCALPRPTFLRQKDFLRQPKREDDGREGAISGRLARKATGVNPSGFARAGVLAEKGAIQAMWTFPRKRQKRKGWAR